VSASSVSICEAVAKRSMASSRAVVKPDVLGIVP